MESPTSKFKFDLFVRTALPVVAFGTAVSFCLSVTFSTAALAEEWNFHETSIRSRESNIKKLEQEISEIVHHKKSMENGNELAKANEEITKKYSEYKKLKEEDFLDRLHIRFKHPDRGDKTKREYSKEKIKTIEEIADEAGLPGKLDKIKAKILAKFPPTEEEIRAAEQAKAQNESKSRLRKPASDEENPEWEQIHLKK